MPLWALALYLTTISGYVALLCYGAWRYRSPGGGSQTAARIAVLVPAHNEEHGIAKTIEGIGAAEYPGELLGIVVIADNCTDGTADAARAAGAEVLERSDTQNRGKGQALDWCLKAHAEVLAEYDLIAIIDADMSVDAEFFLHSADAFSEPETRAIQACYSIADPAATWLSAVGFMSFAYVNHLVPAGRCYWGGSTDLKGSGMVFDAALLLEAGWPSHSIAEDLEFSRELLFRGVRIRYVPRARLTSRIPSRLSSVAVQQGRWEGGKVYVLRRFFGRTLARFARDPSVLLADAALSLLVPPLSAILFLAMVGGVSSLAFATVPAYAFAAPIPAFGAAVISGVVQLRPPRRVWLYLLLAPVFFVWKVFLLLGIVFKPKGAEWRRTPRDGEAER